MKTTSLPSPIPTKPKKAKTPVVSEKVIQDAIIRRMRAAGWLTIRVNSTGFTDGKGQFVKGYFIYGLSTSSGFPDVLGLKGDRSLLIEVKNAKGKLTDSQERFHKFAKTYGVEVHTVKDPEEMTAILAA